MATIAQVSQKLDDHIEQQRIDYAEMKGILNQILEQAKKTNGRVTKLESNEENCPAKKYFVEIKDKRDWGMFWATGLSSLGGAVLTVIILKLTHLG